MFLERSCSQPWLVLNIPTRGVLQETLVILFIKHLFTQLKTNNMEKRNSLFVVIYFSIGLFGGWLIFRVSYHQPRHLNTEYFIELKGDSAIVEGIDGHIYMCPIDSIPVVLVKDNL